jgi:Rod binding domain-containing protein
MKINPIQLQSVRPLKPSAISAEQRVKDAEKVQETFRTFVGESFFGQMIKAMRTTQGKPAYFHGGQAEEVFRGQLDQALAQEMTEASADRIADPMFRQQFPREAALLEEHSQKRQTQAGLDDLRGLPRR